MAPQSSDVTRLLTEASRATTYGEQVRLITAAEEAKTEIAATAAADQQVDLANAVVANRLTPVRVHEHHTASTDWLGAMASESGDAESSQREMVAQGSVWYAQRPEVVKQHPEEFFEQAKGFAHRLAGAHGEHADVAEAAFLEHVGSLHRREVEGGVITLTAAMDTNEAYSITGEPKAAPGLPGERTTSERAPAMQDVMNNTSGGSVSDTEWPDPIQLPQQDVDAANGDTGQRKADTNHFQAGRHDFTYDNPHQVEMSHRDDLSGGMDMVRTHPDAPNELRGPMSEGFSHYPGVDNPDEVSRAMSGMTRGQLQQQHDKLVGQGHGDHGLVKMLRDRLNLHDSGVGFIASQKGSTMPHVTAACPECSGCRACNGTHRVAVRVQGASGLDQIDQIVDPHDNPKTTPYPTDEAFPWEMPGDSSQAISETEQQLKQREQLKGASRQQHAAQVAKMAAERAYLRAMAGQDDSGWMGDMGAGGVRPGMQDGGNPGNTYPGNLADPDPVYGYGGDNGNQPLKPYGSDEADDYTNNPGMNWQPGQPTQYDVGARPNQVGQPTAARRSDEDPEVQRALAYVRNRRALIDGN